MEDLCENWISSLEMCDEENSLDEDKFLTEIVQNQLQYFNYSCNNLEGETIMDTSSLSYEEYSTLDSNISHHHHQQHVTNNNSHKKNNNYVVAPSSSSSSSATFILSFEKSTVEPAASSHRDSKQISSILTSKRSDLNEHCSAKSKGVNNKQGNKKFRTSSEIKDHIMAERKRRQDLTEKFIALSATIPGLKKTDKAYILREAINYVKQLQDRVKELENNQSKKESKSTSTTTTASGSLVFIKKSQVCSSRSYDEYLTTCDGANNNNNKSTMPLLPQIEARMLENEVLIGIHCEKENDIVLRIMDLLQNLHLSLVCSSVLPFGNSTLKVTVIAQMGEKYSMNVNDLVESLRQDLLKSMTFQK